MNPADFISLAIKLSNSQQEAELRTAVGRAYYGAFHAARELLEECDIGFPPKELFGADIHRKVQYCLANAGNANADAVATRLHILRRQRNAADYDLKIDSFSGSRTKQVTSNTQRAIEIVDALQHCRTGEAFQQFRDNVRAYARDVLRLPVRQE
jgi:uncharacterized protein (UPF0332 family)